LHVPALSAKVLVTVFDAVPEAFFARARASTRDTGYLLAVPQQAPLNALFNETHWVLFLAKRQKNGRMAFKILLLQA
jgi:hypothetical protein